MRKLTNEEIINKFKNIHHNKYDYSLVEYINSKTKIKIICKKHGIFEQTPDSHSHGSGCSKCNLENSKNTLIEFIEKSNKIHNNKYDYSLVEYINSKTKVKIICPIHGEFEQRPDFHLTSSGCLKCVNSKKTKTNIFFIEQLKKIFKNEYDLSLIDYKNYETNVKVICNIHGVFEKRPDHLLKGGGCPKCNKIISDNKQRKNINNLLKEFNNIHGNVYNYDLVEYLNTYTKVKIICPIHGVFEQLPREHLKGQCCPSCKKSKGEKVIRLYLENNKITFFEQKTFDGCKYKNPLKFDFYLPDYNMCIEFDGKQHYEVNEYFGGIKSFNNQKERDGIKTDYCINNNIKLLRIKYNEIHNIENIINNYLKI